jgi:hypothetical protein
MEAFSDGVFAIAVTLLVLEIAVPAGSGDDLLGALGDQWPSYLGYLVSFATIGAVWFAHTVITEYLDHADSVPDAVKIDRDDLPLSNVSRLCRPARSGAAGWSSGLGSCRKCDSSLVFEKNIDGSIAFLRVFDYYGEGRPRGALAMMKRGCSAAALYWRWEHRTETIMRGTERSSRSRSTPA